MTLLIAVAGENGIHQSSDFRISDQGKSVETAAGTKQMAITTSRWTAHVAFTGIARDGRGYDTRQWLSDLFKKTPQDSTVTAFVEDVTSRATVELSRVTTYDTRLTIVIAYFQGVEPGLYLISNFEAPSRGPLASPKSHASSFRIPLDSPIVMVNGMPRALSGSERNRLYRLYVSGATTTAMREALSAANRRAAAQKKYAFGISAECHTCSILQNGRTESQSPGDFPGLMTNVMAGFDITEWALKHLIHAPGKQISLVGTAGFSGYATPDYPPPRDGFGPPDWVWEHDERQLAEENAWSPGILVSTKWGVVNAPIRPAKARCADQDQARQENRIIARCVADKFGFPLKPARNE
jgi:hypothetical protein